MKWNEREKESEWVCVWEREHLFLGSKHPMQINRKTLFNTIIHGCFMLTLYDTHPQTLGIFKFLNKKSGWAW